ncbi:MAG TPA: CvpA family protein [Roseiflexaceae bacterium]|nr:CvpA family protein [Roseiflexaceae bacterium]
MALAFTIVIVLVLVLLGLVGYIRDSRRGLVALIGTLAGALLVDFWAAQWGQALASRFVGADPQRITFVVSCALLLWGVLLIGYGGGMQLARPKERAVFAQRLAAALLGVLNGVLIVAFLLRFAVASQPAFVATIQASPIARLLYDGLPLLFLSAAAISTLVVLARGVVLVATRRPAPAAPAASSAAAPAVTSSTPTQRIDDRDVLDKVNNATRR